MTTYIPPGKTVCHVTSFAMRIFVKDGVAAKVIVPLKIDVAGEHIEHSEFMTIDPEQTNKKGRPFVEFTIASLKALGAKDPAGDIASALDAGSSEITFAWAPQVEWVPCEVKQNGQYTNVQIGGGIDLDTGKAKKASDAIRRLGGSAAPVVNPFAPPSRGTPIAPPAPGARPAPVMAPAAQAKAQDDIPF